MIRLNTNSFSNAFRKAETVRPLVQRISDHEFRVKRSDGDFTPVVYEWRGLELWIECRNCPAGNPAKHSRAPLPCYHAVAPIVCDVEPAPLVVTTQITHARTHTHFCVRCHDHFRCGSVGCAGVDDSICDDCDQREADQLTWEDCYGSH